MSKFLKEKIELTEDDDIEITNDANIDAIKDTINPADVIEDDSQVPEVAPEQDAYDKAVTRVGFGGNIKELIESTFNTISKLNEIKLFLLDPYYPLDISEEDKLKIQSIVDEALVQENVNVGLYQEVAQTISIEDTDSIKDATENEINSIEDAIDTNQEINSEGSEEVKESKSKNYDLSEYKSYDFTYISNYSGKEKTVNVVEKNLDDAIKELARYAEQDIDKLKIKKIIEIVDFNTHKEIEVPAKYALTESKKVCKSKRLNESKSVRELKEDAYDDDEEEYTGGTLLDAFKAKGDMDITDDVFDWGENFDCDINETDAYNKVMVELGKGIEFIKYNEGWYSPCKVAEYIEKNIDKFNNFLNAVYKPEYQPQNLDKQYTINEDPEEFYDLYMDMMSGLLRGSFSDSDYQTLYDILKGKTVKTDDASKNYIYQFPQGTTEEDIKVAESKYNLKYLGKVGPDGFQPGDIIIQGSKQNLEKFCDEYLGYEMHPDYLLKADEFDTDVLESLDVSKGENDYFAELCDRIGLDTLGDLKNFIEEQKKEGKDISDVASLVAKYYQQLQAEVNNNK